MGGEFYMGEETYFVYTPAQDDGGLAEEDGGLRSFGRQRAVCSRQYPPRDDCGVRRAGGFRFQCALRTQLWSRCPDEFESDVVEDEMECGR